MQVIKLESVSKSYSIPIRDGNLAKYIFSRKYKTIEAVKDLSFSINKGELVAFLGANGAGKSTTIKLLCGILTQSDGKIRVFGRDPYNFRKENMRNIGVVFGQRSQLWWDLPLKDTYQLLKKIYRIDDRTFDSNIELLNKYLSIKSIWNQPVRMLSLGQRMKGELGAAILHDPEILFLDEPTIGLDVLVKKEVRDFIKEINHLKNTTIFLTSHDMRDVEEICDRVIIINNGRMYDDTDLNELKNRYKNKISFEVLFKNSVTELRNVDVEESTMQNDGHVWLCTIDSHKITTGKFLNDMSKHGEIINLSVKENSIEQIICDLYANMKGK